MWELNYVCPVPENKPSEYQYTGVVDQTTDRTPY